MKASDLLWYTIVPLEDERGSLTGLIVYHTDDKGQMTLVDSWEIPPFDTALETGRHLANVIRKHHRWTLR